jgi:purine catabolism regulator
MYLTLERVLDHPSVKRGDPCVRAGSGGLGRRVRWIHSSEVLDIAPLLRGGELLLTGGGTLGAAAPPEQRRYVRQLAERNVAGVAIETGTDLPAVPVAVLAEAEALGFPVIELRRRIPFVDVAEAVNAELVDESVTRLRFAGELAHALSGVLGRGGDVEALLELLVERTGVPATLLSTTGSLITRMDAGHGSVPPEDSSSVPNVSSRITVRGAHAATLVFHPRPDTDLDQLATVSERATEAVGLALLRSHPPSTRDLAASELARLACRPSPERGRLVQLGQIIGFSADDPTVAIAVIPAAAGAGLPGLDGLLRRYGRIAMDASDTEVRVVISLQHGGSAATQRTALLVELDGWAREREAVVVGVGPVVPDLPSVPTSMELAISALAQRSAYGHGSVVDATTTAIPIMLASPSMRAGGQQLVRGQLSMLLALRPGDGEVLMDTLETYFDSGCNKTRTAELMHLQRQSVYGRLERAFELVGGDPTGTGRALPLHLALRLRHALGQVGGDQPR